MSRVLISVGSNIDKDVNVPAALSMLAATPGITILAVSPILETVAVGADGEPSGQATFYNLGLSAETSLPPADVRRLLRRIEAELGRVRTADKFAARPIDLDLAAYGSAVLTLDGKAIPDPDLLCFLHVAGPLAAVAPDWVHPQTGQTLAEIAAALQAQPR